MAGIIAFAGSPRREGYSWQLLNELVRGAGSKGAQVKIYDLNDPGFRGCQGCFRCRKEPGCPVADILTPFYSEIGEASAVVLTSPIYFGDVTGQVKMWLDRMFPMLDGMAFQPRHPGKKAVTILSQGDAREERFEHAIGRMHAFLRNFGWDLRDSIVCNNVSAPGFTMPEALMKKAFAAGAALADR